MKESHSGNYDSDYWHIYISIYITFFFNELKVYKIVSYYKIFGFSIGKKPASGTTNVKHQYYTYL